MQKCLVGVGLFWGKWGDRLFLLSQPQIGTTWNKGQWRELVGKARAKPNTTDKKVSRDFSETWGQALTRR